MASFEKRVLDTEMLRMLVAVMWPISLDPDELALDAISEVAPGGHHFGTAHTLERFRSAFSPGLLSCRESFETWAKRGGEDTARRANRAWKRLLAEYRRPPIDPAAEASLIDYTLRRKREITATCRSA